MPHDMPLILSRGTFCSFTRIYNGIIISKSWATCKSRIDVCVGVYIFLNHNVNINILLIVVVISG